MQNPQEVPTFVRKVPPPSYMYMYKAQHRYRCHFKTQVLLRSEQLLMES